MLADFHRNVTLWFPMEEAKGAVGRSEFSEKRKRDFIHHAALSVKPGERMPRFIKCSQDSVATTTSLPQ